MKILTIEYCHGVGPIATLIRRLRPIGGGLPTPAHVRIVGADERSVIEAVLPTVQRVPREMSGVIAVARIVCTDEGYFKALMFAGQQVGKPYDLVGIGLALMALVCRNVKDIGFSDRSRL